MGLSVALRTPPQAQIYLRVHNLNNNEIKLESIGHSIWARIFGRVNRALATESIVRGAIAAIEQ
jgi:hypothetical protein